MNILFLTHEYKHGNLPESGGTGVFISNLAKELVKKGHNVYVFSLTNTNLVFNDDGVIVKIKKNTLIKNHFYKLARSVTRKVSFLKRWHLSILKLEVKEIVQQLNLYIKKNHLQIDIIETHDFRGLSLYLNNSIPYIVRCHGSFSIFKEYFYKNFDVPKIILECEYKANRKAKNIITISEYSRKINYEFFKINKSKLIYNGINTDLYKANDNVKIIEKSIFYFGNISIEKGADIVIEVFLNILKHEHNATLHFIGRGFDYKTEVINKIKENNIQDKIIFHGFQNPESSIKLLSSAEVVVFPSKGENFSLAILEVLSLAKVVVCSNIPSYQEVIIDKENGFIANSIQDYIDSILFIFNNSDMALAIGKNARKTIIKNFNQNKMVEETINYYREVIKNNKKLQSN